MLVPLRTVIVVASLLVPMPGRAGNVEDAGAVLDKWAAAFSANDADSMTKLFTDDAVLTSVYVPHPEQGMEAIRRHFAAYLRGSGNKVAFRMRQLTGLGEDAAMATGMLEFTVVEQGKPEPVPSRFSFVLVRRGGAWMIAHQHTSAVPRGRH